jgi:hypothetical protein
MPLAVTKGWRRHGLPEAEKAAASHQSTTCVRVAKPARKAAPYRDERAASVRYRTAAVLGNPSFRMHVSQSAISRRFAMNAIIYLVGLVVVVMFILSLIGLR